MKNTHKVTLGRLAQLIYDFEKCSARGYIPKMPYGSFEKKLYATYLSYLPEEKVSYPLFSSSDERGSFTEIIKNIDIGQMSVNITKPGATKGCHWHNTKWEIFVVVSGRALIKERSLDSGEIISFEVCGDKPHAVRMLPGYTHSITNISDKDDLVTLMFANEIFDSERPDTFFEVVD